MIGGDHSIATPILRAIHGAHGPVCVVHVDAHFDTTDAAAWGDDFHHGTPIRHALADGHIHPGGLFQIGLRGGWKDENEADTSLGHDARLFPALLFERRDADSIADEILTSIGDRSVYLSVDVDGSIQLFAPGPARRCPAD